jgi:hypothetical protein
MCMRSSNLCEFSARGEVTVLPAFKNAKQA